MPVQVTAPLRRFSYRERAGEVLLHALDVKRPLGGMHQAVRWQRWRVRTKLSIQIVRGGESMCRMQLRVPQKPNTDATAQIPGAAEAPSSRAAIPASSVAMRKDPTPAASRAVRVRLPLLATVIVAVAPTNNAVAIHSKRMSWPVWTARTSATPNGVAAKSSERRLIPCARIDRVIAVPDYRPIGSRPTSIRKESSRVGNHVAQGRLLRRVLARGHLYFPVLQANSREHDAPDEVSRRLKGGHDHTRLRQLRPAHGVADQSGGIVER
jgi:hypothetical protein